LRISRQKKFPPPCFFPSSNFPTFFSCCIRVCVSRGRSDTTDDRAITELLLFCCRLRTFLFSDLFVAFGC
jgi:hypothetical protein